MRVCVCWGHACYSGLECWHPLAHTKRTEKQCYVARWVRLLTGFALVGIAESVLVRPECTRHAVLFGITDIAFVANTRACAHIGIVALGAHVHIVCRVYIAPCWDFQAGLAVSRKAGLALALVCLAKDL